LKSRAPPSRERPTIAATTDHISKSWSPKLPTELRTPERLPSPNKHAIIRSSTGPGSPQTEKRRPHSKLTEQRRYNSEALPPAADWFLLAREKEEKPPIKAKPQNNSPLTVLRKSEKEGKTLTPNTTTTSSGAAQHARSSSNQDNIPST